MRPARVMHLTTLLEKHSTLSFLRLGDGELRFLLQVQGGEGELTARNLRASCEIAYGDPGLTKAQGKRLLASYERCSFLDLYGGLPYNNEHLPRLRWHRDPRTLGNASSGAIGLLFEWLYHDFRHYLSQHRSLICGAEAVLLEQLLKDPEYRRIASPFWPESIDVLFVQPRHDGARLSQDLDLIKEDLKAAVREHCPDTLFLSLGGASKIIGYELAQELGIRAVDFGSALRALTYSGSDGYAGWRASHHPHLLRVPFDVYMRALRKAHPDLSPAMLVAKAHAQLCLELQRKDLLKSGTSDANDGSMFDATAQNLRNFWESMRTYRREILPLVERDQEALALAREFRLWRWKKGLDWDGRLFQLGVLVKGLLRSLWGLVALKKIL
jgi:hypothetical protein